MSVSWFRGSSSPGNEPEVQQTLLLIEERLNALQARSRQVWRAAATEIHPDLQGSGYRALAILYRQGPMRSSELADTLDVDRSLISRQLKQLARLRLVRSAPDPADGRGRVFAVTETARERLQRYEAATKQQVFGPLLDWPHAELITLGDLLDRWVKQNRT